MLFEMKLSSGILKLKTFCPYLDGNRRLDLFSNLTVGMPRLLVYEDIIEFIQVDGKVLFETPLHTTY